MKLGTMFSGMGGVETGGILAGVNPVWGIEIDPRIASVADRNLETNTIIDSVLEVDPHTLDKVDILHASPPCPNFSAAKQGAEESALDISLAKRVANYIRVLSPKYFTLENVYGYRNSESWKIISSELVSLGYWVVSDHVNSANYGVPQKRMRMIVRAVRNSFANQMSPTHSNHLGWYSAVSDLLPCMGQFSPSPSHMDLIKEVNHRRKTDDILLMDTQNVGRDNKTILNRNRPSFTIAASASSSYPAVSMGDELKRLDLRCLARLQSFPDRMSKHLHPKAVGNAVPPLLYKEILEQTIQKA